MGPVPKEKCSSYFDLERKSFSRIVLPLWWSLPARNAKPLWEFSDGSRQQVPEFCPKVGKLLLFPSSQNERVWAEGTYFNIFPGPEWLTRNPPPLQFGPLYTALIFDRYTQDP